MYKKKNKYMEIYSTIVFIRETETETTSKYYHIPDKMTKETIKPDYIKYYVVYVEELELSQTVGSNVKW